MLCIYVFGTVQCMCMPVVVVNAMIRSDVVLCSIDIKRKYQVLMAGKTL